MIKKILLLLITFFTSGIINAQNYDMSNGLDTINCITGGSLFDSGGNGGQYSDNENLVFTICPSDTGSGVVGILDIFNLGTGDSLYIYDGVDVNAPLFSNMPMINNTPVNTGATFPATTANPTGCLTFEFISNGDNDNGDFSFFFDCAARCQTFYSSFSLIQPDTTLTPTDLYINVCLGDTVFMNAVNTYPNNNDEYYQDDTSSSFIWYWEQSTAIPDSGQNQYHVYNDAGGYFARMESYDQHGCRNNQDQIFKVRVAPIPEFTQLGDTILCVNEIDSLSGLPLGLYSGGTTVVGQTIDFNPPIQQVGTFQLQDGLVNHTDTAYINDFSNGAVVNGCGEIKLKTKIEHSYIEDLEMTITCPNGTTVSVINGYSGSGAGNLTPGGFGGTTTFLGQPIDANQGNPGYGWNYEFFDSAPNPEWVTPLPTIPVTPVASPSGIMTSAGNSIDSGQYQPDEAFAGLNGCPLNGAWVLTVRDNLLSDDGFIFSWSIEFPTCLYPEPDSFQMIYNIGNWDPASTITGIVVDSHTITIQPDTIGLFQYTYNTADQFGCEYSNLYEIYSDGIEFEVLPADTAVCQGDPTQLSANITSNPISSSLSYSWSPSTDLNNSNIQNPIATLSTVGHTYVAEVTTQNGCSFYDTANVLIDASFEFDAMTDTFICAGQSIDLWATGGAIQYAWTPNDGSINDTTLANPTVTPSTTTTYTVQADSTGCSQYANITVSVSNITSAFYSYNPGAGSLLSLWNGGIGPLSYTLDGVSVPNGILSGLSQGQHTLVISDGSGCDSVHVFGTAPLIIDSVYTVSPTCNTANGEIEVYLDDPSIIATYTLTPGTIVQNNGIFTGLADNTYTISIDDGAGGTVDTVVVLTALNAVSLTVVDSTDLTCYNSADGLINLSASGGALAYEFAIDGSTFTTNTNYPALNAGTYITVVKDNNGCLDTIPVTLTQPDSLEITNIVVDAVLCFGDSANISFSGIGGTANYQYSISPIASFGASNTFNMPAGNYSLQIQDANNCLSEITLQTVYEPTAALNLVFDSVVNSLCGIDLGIAYLSNSGGTAPYSYTIDGGLNTQDSTTFINLVANNYTVQVTDNNGCIDSVSGITITSPTPLELTVVDSIDLTCYNDASGLINLSAINGTVNYEFAIDGNTFSTTTNYPSLDAGSYMAVVKDMNGCLDSISVVLTQPDSLEIINLVVDTVLCSGDSANISFDGLGGTIPYTYSIMNVPSFNNVNAYNVPTGNYSIQVQDASNCMSAISLQTVYGPSSPLTIILDSVLNSNCTQSDGAMYFTVSGGTSPYTLTKDNGATTQSSETFLSVSAGIYTVTVTDAAGCSQDIITQVQDNASVTISVISFDSISCFGVNDASVHLSGTLGALPYEYKLDNGAYQTDSFFLNLNGGNHTFTIKDANGCTDATVVNIFEPSQMVPSFTQVDLNCDESGDGEIHVTIAGGTIPYAYALDVFASAQANGDFLNLDAGNHTVYVVDANGCSDTITPITLTQPDTLVVTNVIVTDINCNGGTGSFTVSVSGGSTPYSYNVNSGVNQTSNVLGGLSGGIYTINVTDDNNCPTVSLIDTIFEPTALTISFDSTQNITCFGGNDGYISTLISGGVAPYTYSVDNVAFQNSNEFNNLTAGSYTVYVKDDNNCTISLTIVLTQPNEILLTIQTSPVSCAGLTDASIILNNITGGSAPYTASLDAQAQVNVINGFVFSNLASGNHTVQIFDANCSSIVYNISLSNPDSLELQEIAVSDVTCFGDGNGSVTVQASSGTPQYTFGINVNGTIINSNTGNQATFNNLDGGIYPVYVLDANLCPDTISVTVNEPVALVIDSIEVLEHIACFGESSGSIIVFPSGGNPFASPSLPYTYSWSPSLQTDPKASGLDVGVHTVTVTDSEGCTATASETITSVAPIIATIMPDSAYISMGDTLQLSVNVQNVLSTAVLSYSWSPSTGLSCTDCANPMVTIYNDIDYSVVVSDENGCSNINFAEVFISVNPSLFFFIPNGFSPNGDGVNDKFQVYGQDIKSVSMVVFNRWGEKLFEGTNQFDAWDGTYNGVLQGNGVYTYDIELEFLNDAKVIRKGSVSLIK